MKLLLTIVTIALSSDAVFFECDYEETTWSPIPNAYTCVAEVVSTANKLELEKIKGDHDEGKTNDDVVFLYIYNQKLEKIPNNLNKFFPNVKVLEWNNSNLKSLSAEDLKQYPELITFSSYYNDIVTLESDVFKYNPKLQWIYFHKSNIQHVGEGLLDGLDELTFVNFERNPCINTYGRTPEQIKQLNKNLPIKCPMKSSEPEKNDEL